MRYLKTYKMDKRQPFVNDIDAHGYNIPNEQHIASTIFSFPTTLVDSYEKYPESLVSGLTQIGGILALFKIV